MNEAGFRQWLCDVYRAADGSPLTARTRAARISNCRRVEYFEGDLDQHFEQDGLGFLLQRLDYPSSAFGAGLPPEHAIPIDGNAFTGTATLRTAIRLYGEYRTAHDPDGESPAPVPALRRKARRSAPAVNAWPSWPGPDEEQVLALARIIAPFVRFLSPAIVGAVAQDNARQRQEWSTALAERGVDPALYLWDDSPCTFPGVRRYAGSREIAAHRGQVQLGARPEGALRLDDNDYPKQIWSFVFRGSRFTKFGPPDHALAHLLDHKAYGNRAETELLGSTPTGRARPLFGLFTSAANAVYIPRSLIRPTDFGGALRNLLIRRAEALYGDVCRILPPGLTLPEPPREEWALDRFTWAEPVGTTEHLERFLEFRRDEVTRLIEECPASAPAAAAGGASP